jgi:hypothetical protein
MAECPAVKGRLMTDPGTASQSGHSGMPALGRPGRSGIRAAGGRRLIGAALLRSVSKIPFLHRTRNSYGR